MLQNGRLRAVLGASGGPLIVSSVLQTLVRLLARCDHGIDLIAKPRFHHQVGILWPQISLCAAIAHDRASVPDFCRLHQVAMPLHDAVDWPAVPEAECRESLASYSLFVALNLQLLPDNLFAENWTASGTDLSFPQHELDMLAERGGSTHLLFGPSQVLQVCFAHTRWSPADYMLVLERTGVPIPRARPCHTALCRPQHHHVSLGCLRQRHLHRPGRQLRADRHMRPPQRWSARSVLTLELRAFSWQQ